MGAGSTSADAPPAYSPGLERFFASMSGYLRSHPSDPGLLTSQSEWDSSPERLGIYGRWIQEYVHEILEKLYPACRSLLPRETWSGLLHAYYRERPARHYEINRAGVDFAQFLAARPELPPCLTHLARFEWTRFSVTRAAGETPPRVEVLTVNPTLETLSHPWQLCRFYQEWAQGANDARPEPGEEVALIWRHPRSSRACYREADARALLVLKLALEGIPADRAAREGGVEPAEVEAALLEFQRNGLLLGPSSL